MDPSGEAVGIGMVQEAAIAQYLGICDRELVERQSDLILRCGITHSHAFHEI